MKHWKTRWAPAPLFTCRFCKLAKKKEFVNIDPKGGVGCVECLTRAMSLMSKETTETKKEDPTP